MRTKDKTIKKVSALILSFGVCISMCACGGFENKGTMGNGKESIIKQDKATAYSKAIECLKTYADESYIYVEEDEATYSYHEATEKLYQMFSELGDYENATEILKRFIVSKNQLMREEVVTKDNLEQITYEGVEFYFFYDENNKISLQENPNIEFVSANNDEGPWQFVYDYDEEGRLVETRCVCKSNDSYNYIENYQYDVNDNVSKYTKKTAYNTYEPSFTYSTGEDGNITKGSGMLFITDRNFSFGNEPIECFSSEGVSELETAYECIYDGNGNLVTIKYTCTIPYEKYSWAGTYQFEYDGKGNMVEYYEKDEKGEIDVHKTYVYENNRLVKRIEYPTSYSTYSEFSYVYGDVYSIDLDGLDLDNM